MSFLTWPLRCTWAHNNKDAAKNALQPPAGVTSNHAHNFKYLLKDITRKAEYKAMKGVPQLHVFFC